jgi:uncharacterized membrane protein
METNLLTVTLFSKADCHLCKQAEDDLIAINSVLPHKLIIIDIDDDPDLQRSYGLEIPVVKVGPYTLKAPFNQKKLRMTIGAALDRKNQLETVGDHEYKKRVQRGQTISRADRFSYWFSRHYLLVFNLFVLLYVGLPFLAPVLEKAELTTPAGVIYRIYGGLCHQLSFRSWFLFGEQPFYPRETAGVVGYASISQVTGLNEQDLLESRRFIGNEVVGYKVALCQRDVAIYGAILLFGVIFGITGRRIKPLHIILWVILGLVPIGVDGLSQLVSQMLIDPTFKFLKPIANILPYRESTPFLRTLTGFLFGFTTAWFGYPLVEETMADARRLLATKFATLGHGSGK